MTPHEEDLAFLAELREADLAGLHRIRLNLNFGGPQWQRIAVDRAIARSISPRVEPAEDGACRPAHPA